VYPISLSVFLSISLSLFITLNLSLSLLCYVYLYLRVLYRVCLNTKAGNRYQIIDYLQGNIATEYVIK
jgi:hypothetical protein